MAETFYYHLSKAPLNPGTVLESRFVKFQYQWEAIESALGEPDQYAILKALLLTDRIRGEGRRVPLAFVLKEVILERIRISEFAQLPSRLTSIFACPSKEDAVKFRSAIQQTDDRPHLYLCTVEDTEQLFEADMGLVGAADPLAPIRAQLLYLTGKARLYWQGDKGDDPALEILAPAGAVKITAGTDW